MKYAKSLIFYLVCLLSQTFMAFANPINASDSLDKRSRSPDYIVPSKIFFYKPKGWGKELYAYYYTKSEQNKYLDTIVPSWPGKRMFKGYNYNTDFDDKEYDLYFVTIPYGIFEDSHIVFSDGQNQVPAVLDEGFDLIPDGIYNENGIIGVNEFKGKLGDESPKNCDNCITVYYSLYNNEYEFSKIFSYGDEIYIHYKIGNGEWNSVPGKKLEKFEFTYYKYATVELGDADEITFAFTNGKDAWDNNHGMNYKCKKFQNCFINLKPNKLRF